jgi:hypothetical protein
MMKKTFLALLAVAITTVLPAQVLISEFDFNSPGTSNSSGNTGTFSNIGGTTIADASDTVNGGSSSPFGATGARNLSSFPAQSTASGTAGARVDVTTVGYTNLLYSGVIVEFDLRLSNAASRWYRIDYTTDGTTFTLGTPTRIGVGDVNSGDSWTNNISFTISDPATLNNPNFGFRVVSVFSPLAFTEHNSGTNYAANTAYEAARNWTGLPNTSYGTLGTWRFDMIQIYAIPIPEPGTYALLAFSLVALVLVRRRLAKKSLA